MNGKTLLAKLLGSTAAPAAAVAVAAGKPGLSAEDQAAGTTELEGIAEKAFEEGRKAGVPEGAKAERERFGAVFTGEHAADNMALAVTLLSTTENTPDQINAALKAAGPRIAAISTEIKPEATAKPEQRSAEDPLKADEIAGKTPLVDTGAPQPPKDGMDEAACAKLWGSALETVNGGGITKGSVWDGLGAGQAN